jgi:porphobilinogen deaminase
VAVIRIEAVPLTTAVQYKAAHEELNPEHRLLLAVCGGCSRPVGLLCLSCREPICAIDDQHDDGSSCG